MHFLHKPADWNHSTGAHPLWTAALEQESPSPPRLPRRSVAHALGAVCTLLLTSWGGTVYPWASPIIIAAGGGAALFMLLWRQPTASEPLMPLRLFSNQVFVIAV